MQFFDISSFCFAKLKFWKCAIFIWPILLKQSHGPIFFAEETPLKIWFSTGKLSCNTCLKCTVDELWKIVITNLGTSWCYFTEPLGIQQLNYRDNFSCTGCLVSALHISCVNLIVVFFMDSTTLQQGVALMKTNRGRNCYYHIMPLTSSILQHISTTSGIHVL